MQFLVYAIITSSLSFEYLAAEGYVSSMLPFVQELSAIAAAAVVVAAGVSQRFANIAGGYWLVFGALALCLVCGLLTNGVDAGPAFAGMRSYLRAIPLFFLPAVIAFSERQIKAQLLLILAFAVIQLPIAVDQRLTTFDAGFLSGDRTFGTVMHAGHLSIFLACVASVVFAFWLRGRLRLGWFLVLMPILLVPTMLNETKAMVFLVPIALLAVVMIGATANRMRNVMIAVIGTAIFTAAFIPTYDYFMKPRWGYGIVEFFMMEGRVEEYLSQGSEVGSFKPPGRVDSITVPLRVLSSDPSLLAFGLGIGNVSDSALGAQFTGEHFARYGYFVQSFASELLWETGVLGLLLVLVLFGMLFVDAFRVSRGDGFHAALALGTLGVIALVCASVPYATMIDSAAVSYLFWYVAGIVAAERMRSTVTEKRPAVVPGKRQIAYCRLRRRASTTPRIADAVFRMVRESPAGDVGGGSFLARNPPRALRARKSRRTPRRSAAHAERVAAPRGARLGGTRGNRSSPIRRSGRPSRERLVRLLRRKLSDPQPTALERRSENRRARTAQLREDARLSGCAPRRGHQVSLGAQSPLRGRHARAGLCRVRRPLLSRTASSLHRQLDRAVSLSAGAELVQLARAWDPLDQLAPRVPHGGRRPIAAL